MFFLSCRAMHNQRSRLELQCRKTICRPFDAFSNLGARKLTMYSSCSLQLCFSLLPLGRWLEEVLALGETGEMEIRQPIPQRLHRCKSSGIPLWPVELESAATTCVTKGVNK